MKLHNYTLIVIIFIAVAFSPTATLAHPGRTDSFGCHTCRTNCPKWGLLYEEYHCHRSKGITQPKKPIKSHLNKNGTGYTDSAPEYKIPVKVEPSQNYKQPEKIKDGWIKRLVKVFGI